MSEYEKARIFNENLEVYIGEDSPIGAAAVSREEKQLLELASILKANDFTQEDGTRERIRRRVLNSGKEEVFQGRQKVFGFFGKRHPGMVWGTLAATTVLTLAMIFPGTTVAVAKDVAARIVKTIQLSSNMIVIEMAPEEVSRDEGKGEVTFTATEKEEGKTTETTVKVAKEGAVEQTGVISYSTLAKAQEETRFAIKTPDYLPQGYSFNRAEGYEGSDEYIDLYFDGPGQEIILMQREMNEDTGFVLGTDMPVEEIEVNGAKGAWTEPHTVMWEKDGVGYSLFCKGFDKEEAIKIARSIK